MIEERGQTSNVGDFSYTVFTPICTCCGDKLIEVARSFNVPFYSCHKEECENYAELLINTGDQENPMFVGFYDMIKAMNNVATDLEDDEEKVDSEKSEEKIIDE